MESIVPILIVLAILLFRVTAQQLGVKKEKTVPGRAPAPEALPVPESFSLPEVQELMAPETADRAPMPADPQPGRPKRRKRKGTAETTAPAPVERETLTERTEAVPRIRIDSPQTARQAFLYGEIFHRKY